MERERRIRSTVPRCGIALASTAVAGTLLVAVLAFDPSESQSSSRSSGGELDLVVSGCREVTLDDVCLVAETSTLTMWTSTRGSVEVSATLPGARSEVAPRLDGTRITIPVPPSTARIRVAAKGRTREVHVGRYVESAREEELLGIKEERGCDGVLATVDAARLEGWPPRDRAVALGLYARCAFALGRDDWRTPLTQAIELDSACGDRRRESEDRAALSYFLRVAARDFTGARGAVEPLEQAPWIVGEARVLAAYYRALVARDSGDIRNAVRLLNDVITWSDRLGMKPYRVAAATPMVGLLQTLGRHADAAAATDMISRSIPQESAPCSQGMLLNNVGWFELQAAETVEQVKRAQSTLERAVSILSECSRGASLRRAAKNSLAHALLRRGDAAGARTLLGTMGHEGSRESSLERLLLEAMTFEALGELSEAERSFGALVQYAQVPYLPERVLQGHAGRGRVLDRKGAVEEALEAYRRAEVILDELARQIPHGVGAEGFLRTHSGSTDEYVDLLVRLDRFEEAFHVATRAEVRGVVALDVSGRIAGLTGRERERWEAAVRRYFEARDRIERTQQELWTLPENRRIAALHDLKEVDSAARSEIESVISEMSGIRHRYSRDVGYGLGVLSVRPNSNGWHVFVRTTGRVTYHSMNAHDGGGTFDEALSEMTEADSEIRIGVMGRLTDEHDSRLVDRAIAHQRVGSMVRLLGLGSGKVTTRITTALVISDPDGTLPVARAEGESVATLLDASGVDVVRLTGEEATIDRVLNELRSHRFDLMHFAGHGVNVGIDGWHSELKLARGHSLHVSDILSLQNLPETVVMSGCQTAGRATNRSGGAVGIAQAFLLAGAKLAIAADREVRDDSAKELMERLYSHTELVASGELDRALMLVQREKLGKDGEEWRAYGAYAR